MTRYLGVDYGSKRIGLAIGDDASRLSLPVGMTPARGDADQQARDVLKQANAYEFDVVVVGLPLNMDGTEGPQVKLTRKFGQALAKATAKPVQFFDERLSTFAAREEIREADQTRRAGKKRLDAMAARQMPLEFLEQLP